MRTAHEAAADIDAACIDLGDAEHVKADGNAADVHDGIGRADFMERNLVSGDAMHMTLGLGEHLEDAERNRLGAIRERRALNHRTNIAHRTMMVVLMMLVVLTKLWTRLRFLHFHINVCGCDAVLSNLRNLEFALLHDGELCKLATKDMFVHARRQERPEQHVAAQAGKCIEIDCFCHNFPLSSGG